MSFSTKVTIFVLVAGAACAALALGCSKSSSSSGGTTSASAAPSSVALASADAPRATPNSTAAAQVPISGAGPWDHHCDIAAKHTCIEWGQPDKSECDAAQGTYGAGPCVRSPLALGTCVLATGKTSTGDPAPVKRILYNAGAGGAMKADNAHAMCDRESLAGVSDVTHMWKDGPAAARR
jgi:hypothetical protein